MLALILLQTMDTGTCDAIALLYRKYERLMFKVALEKAQNEQDAEDAVHDAFVIDGKLYLYYVNDWDYPVRRYIKELDETSGKTVGDIPYYSADMRGRGKNCSVVHWNETYIANEITGTTLEKTAAWKISERYDSFSNEGTMTERYLRLLGRVNRALAARADNVCEVVCGVPVYYKGGELP